MNDWVSSLFDPHERDACGTGFVADVRGRRSHGVLRDALRAVQNLEHRGAVSRDGRTSDGAGVLTQIPRELVGAGPDDALGTIFFQPEAVAQGRQIIEECVASSRLELAGWRAVPFAVHVLGRDAQRDRPEPWQVILAPSAALDDAAFVRELHLVRRRVERAVRGQNVLSIPSWSRTTIVYKGLVVPELLDQLYPDLADPRYETAIAIFHQRYSTNTSPSWRLAQPFRFLAHNGEINTLLGNVNRMAARERVLDDEAWGESLAELFPVIEPGGSDSAALDNALDFLVTSGRDVATAMAMLVPEAYEARRGLTPAWRAFARYHSALMESWDGPASLVFSDGAVVGATLDRNGLRPLRFWLTSEERIIVGSEAGIVPTEPSDIVEKGRLGPGQMLLVDTAAGRVLRNDEIKESLGAAADWVGWAKEHVTSVGSIDEADVPALYDESLVRVQKLFGYGREHLERILAPMGLEGTIPVGSMGDDTPLAVLSENPQRLYGYFMQRFAQVTNPPIDPLRERLVMSLTTRISTEGQLLDREPHATLIEFESPVISAGHLAWLERETDAVRLDATFSVDNGLDGLEVAMRRLREQAENAVRNGAKVVVISDRNYGSERIPVPMLLATAGIYHHLVRKGLGVAAAIVCDAGDVIEDHDVACLVGFGATLVHPWLAYESVAGLARKEVETAHDPAANYRAAAEKGLLKIMAKLGIADVNSFRGAQTFEALGIDYAVAQEFFTGCPSRIGGVTLRDVAASLFAFHADAYGADELLRELGIYRFRRDGEYHAFHPGVFKWLHKAVREQDVEAYRTYADAVDTRPPTSLRDLLTTHRAETPLPLHEVEPAEEIARRFCTQAMSFGSLSREAHELLAVAMNKIGGKSNSGEGGEEPSRLHPYGHDAPERSVAAWHPHAGDVGTSAIKQVASGRFGVTPDYLVSARQLEIKMAQGSKPGEGGQIPGFKVTEEIAATRRSQPGITLISPPPHHDIYSIEDLAQLIYDLKRVNEEATVAVKLVSVVGIGTIATGVAKGYADAIQISGHDGGTGASPLGSIKHAGLPWELGLGEVQQRLVENDLRGRVTLRVDGGLKTGRDVVIAALLGAEEFGFGTAALVAAGCVMARQCHSNTCPVGVATQREDLRARFPGRPEHVVSFMMFVAEHVRMILAEMGFRTLDEIIGRVELLEPRSDLPERAQRVDLNKLLWEPDRSGERARKCERPRNDRPEATPLNQLVAQACEESWEPGLQQIWRIDNGQRSVGARLSGRIARRGERLPDGHFDLRFEGEAGQSFGVFCNDGMRLTLVGEAQDYVAKGMAGGEIVLRPNVDGSWVIMGNTVAYGATGGVLLAAGAAGERLAVRNSGATVVVEGCGDHGCEYMTGGTVVVLGETGINFAAGMSGGEAYVWDPDGALEGRLNRGMADMHPLEAEDERYLASLLQRHVAATASARAAAILAAWESHRDEFRAVRPRAVAAAPAQRTA